MSGEPPLPKTIVGNWQALLAVALHKLGHEVVELSSADVLALAQRFDGDVPAVIAHFHENTVTLRP